MQLSQAMGECENPRDLKGFTVAKAHPSIHFVCETAKKPHPQTCSVIQKMESLSGSYTAICHLWRTDVNWKERKRTRAVKKNIDLYSAVFSNVSSKPPQNSNACRSRRPIGCDLTPRPRARRLPRNGSHRPTKDADGLNAVSWELKGIAIIWTHFLNL